MRMKKLSILKMYFRRTIIKGITRALIGNMTQIKTEPCKEATNMTEKIPAELLLVAARKKKVQITTDPHIDTVEG